MGGEMTTFIGPGVIRMVPRGWMKRVPLMLTGTMGCPALMAMMNTPFLKGKSSRVRARVPSGKMIRETPRLTMAVARSRLLTAERRLSRSTEMEPMRLRAWPKTGI
jgi:hypothetical protein